MHDNKIIALLWQRSEEALTALAERFGSQLRRIAMNILGSFRDAEETVSDTYLAVWNAIPPRKPESLTGFVCQTGRNQALKKLRSRSAEKRSANYDLSLEELGSCIPGPALEETVEARELGSAIDRFLEAQSPQTRALFLRRYWFGDGVKDIAHSFGMKEPAVSLRLSRTRDKLRSFLEKEGYGNV